MTDFERISKVIQYLNSNFKEQPNLEKLAELTGLSSFHFQRLFKEWAGVSPKKFLQYISIEHAKKLLSENNSISEVSYETGFSGSSRLHDLFISIEGMTPGMFKCKGKELIIMWGKYQTIFGEVLIGSTSIGICYMAFIGTDDSGIDDLKIKFPDALFLNEKHPFHQNALSVFQDDLKDLQKIKLHLNGTSFQLKVWEALLKIPAGSLMTYSGLAEIIESPRAARAVGSAVGANPVAYLIPCHRVIRATGVLGEYHWGSTLKEAMIGRESARKFGE